MQTEMGNLFRGFFSSFGRFELFNQLGPQRDIRCRICSSVVACFIAFKLHRFADEVSHKSPAFLSPHVQRRDTKCAMPAGPAIPGFLDRTRSAAKIIVIDFGFLGDSVHLVPALWEIKRHYPKAELHTLSAKVGAELLALAPCVDRVWTIPLTAKSPPWWKHWDVLWALRRQEFDIAFNFTGSDRSLFATAFVGARQSLCVEGRRHFWNSLIAREWVQHGSREIPVFEQRRKVLAASGFSLEAARFDLCVPEEARQYAQQAVAENSIHLSINASKPTKEWPLENWIGLANLLLASDAKLHLVATCGPSTREHERVAALAKAVDSPRLSALPGLGVARLAAVMQRSRLHIGGDSGPLHLAMALGLPTLAVLRHHPGFKEWLPVGDRHKHLATACRCIHEDRTDCLTIGKAECLASISPQQAVKEALALLAGC
jgi:ADP-heptose:LPS heptosyltransferase